MSETIKVSKETKEKLSELGKKGQSYESIISDLIDFQVSNTKDSSAKTINNKKLKVLLIQFGVPNFWGVLTGMECISPSLDNISTLKMLLDSVGTPKEKVEAIVNIWENHILNRSLVNEIYNRISKQTENRINNKI